MHISGRQMLFGAAAALACLATVPATAYLQAPAQPGAVEGVKAGVDAWQAGDFAGAVRRFRPLAERGDPDAQYNMAQAYRMGRGVPADLKIAQSWYQKSAAQGHELAQANLGLILYEAGKRAEAMPWIKKAAARGDARAQYVLGIELTNGDLLPKDWPRAYALMTRAAAQGLSPAATSLAQMDQFVPLAERQKGIALARQMERGAPVAVAALQKAPRIAGAVPAPARTAPAPKPAVAAATSNRAPAPVARPIAGGGWRAQLGAYGSPAAAQAQWGALSRKIGALSGLQPSYEQAGKFTRLRAGPLPSRAAADKVCASAKAAGQACFPVAP